MAKFEYVGSSEKVVFRGLTFLPNVPMEITDSEAIEKLTNNRFFNKVSGAEAQKPSPPARAQPPKPQVQAATAATKAAGDDEDLV